MARAPGLDEPAARRRPMTRAAAPGGANPLATIAEADLRALFAPPDSPARRPPEALTRRHDPSLNVAFRVLVDGAPIDVAQITGLALAADPAGLEAARYPAGALTWRAPPLPLRLMLGRALTGDRSLYEWRRAALTGDVAMRRVTIHHLDRDRNRVLNGWELQGWPIAWTGPDFDANDGALAWETLEILAHDLLWLEEIPDGDPA